MPPTPMEQALSHELNETLSQSLAFRAALIEAAAEIAGFKTEIETLKAEIQKIKEGVIT